MNKASQCVWTDASTHIVAMSHAVSLSLRSYFACFSTMDAETLGRTSSPSSCDIENHHCDGDDDRKNEQMCMCI